MRSKMNISIDDVSPHRHSGIKVVERCFELIDKFEDIKFTLFVPAAYWRTIKPGTITPFPLYLYDYPELCDTLRELPKENFEIGYHGYFHGIPGKTDNDEFQFLSYKEANKVFELMTNTVEQAGLKDSFAPIFRPPAWRMSPEAIKSAKDNGIEILALSPKKYAKDIYAGADEEFKDVVYFNSNPPFDPLQIFEKTEIVYHACEWDRNYLSKKYTIELSSFIEENKKDIDFCFMKEML